MNADVHTLAGAYALDALPAEERRRFAEHLAACAPCRREVAELQQVAARLALDAAENPPPALRTRLLEATRQTRQLPPRIRVVQPADPAHRRRWRRVLAAAAASIVLVGGASVALPRILGGGEPDPISAVVTASDAETSQIRLRGGGRLTIVSSRQLQQAVVIAEDLPTLGQGRVYQLWRVDPAARAASAGVLRTLSTGVTRARLVADVRPGDRVAITREPRGGSRQPTTTPLGLSEAL